MLPNRVPSKPLGQGHIHSILHFLFGLVRKLGLVPHVLTLVESLSGHAHLLRHFGMVTPGIVLRRRVHCVVYRTTTHLPLVTPPNFAILRLIVVVAI